MYVGFSTSARRKDSSSSQDADTTGISCISNWKQLLDLFYKEGLLTINRDAILILFHVRMLAHNVSTSTVHSLNSTCCTLNDSSDSCIMMTSFANSLIGHYPPPLLIILSSVGIPVIVPQYDHIIRHTMREICWEPQIPFCHKKDIYGIVMHFVTKVSV